MLLGGIRLKACEIVEEAHCLRVESLDVHNRSQSEEHLTSEAGPSHGITHTTCSLGSVSGVKGVVQWRVVAVAWRC